MLLHNLCLPLLFALASASNEQSTENTDFDFSRSIVNNRVPLPNESAISPHDNSGLRSINTYWDQSHWQNTRARLLRDSGSPDLGLSNNVFGQRVIPSTKAVDESNIADRNLAILNGYAPEKEPYNPKTEQKLHRLRERIAQANNKFYHHGASTNRKGSELTDLTDRKVNPSPHVRLHQPPEGALEWLLKSAGSMCDFCRLKTGVTIVLKGLLDDGDKVRYHFDDDCEGIVGEPLNCPKLLQVVSECRDQKNVILLEIPSIANPSTRALLESFLKKQLRGIDNDSQFPMFDGVFWDSKNGNPESQKVMIDTLQRVEGLLRYVGLLETRDSYRKTKGIRDNGEIMRYFDLLDNTQFDKWFTSLSEFDSDNILEMKYKAQVPNGGYDEWKKGLETNVSGNRSGREDVLSEGESIDAKDKNINAVTQDEIHKLVLGQNGLEQVSAEGIIEAAKTALVVEDGEDTSLAKAEGRMEIIGNETEGTGLVMAESKIETAGNETERTGLAMTESRIDFIANGTERTGLVEAEGRIEIEGNKIDGIGLVRAESRIVVADDNNNINGDARSEVNVSLDTQNSTKAAQYRAVLIGENKASTDDITIETATLTTVNHSENSPPSDAFITKVADEFELNLYNELFNISGSPILKYGEKTRVITTTVTKCNNDGNCIATATVVEVSIKNCVALGVCKKPANLLAEPIVFDDNGSVDSEYHLRPMSTTTPLAQIKSLQRQDFSGPDKKSDHFHSKTLSAISTVEIGDRTIFLGRSLSSQPSSFSHAKELLSAQTLVASPSLVSLQETSDAHGKHYLMSLTMQVISLFFVISLA